MSGDAWEALRAAAPSLPGDALDRYVAELARWNRAIRLVGPRDLAGIRVQVADSLLPFLLRPPRFPLLDIGSGAGLPALPLAVVHPGRPITCVEPRAKRVAFLRHAVRSLGLRAVQVLEGRLEAGGGPPGLAAAGFSCVTARALADVATVVGLAAPYLAPGGRVYLPRGGDPPVAIPGWRLCEDLTYRARAVGPRRLLIYARGD